MAAEAPDRIRMPSARIAVSILDDEDAMSLMAMGKRGIFALWAFVGLLLLAKSVRNQGRFKGPIGKYAPHIGLTPAQLETAVKDIQEAATANDHEPWIVAEGKDYVIRSFTKWNGSEWGGPRDGAGRKPAIKSNQVDSSCRQDGGFPVPVSVPVSGSVSDHPVLPTTPARKNSLALTGRVAGGTGTGGVGSRWGDVVWTGRDGDIDRLLSELGVWAEVISDIMAWELPLTVDDIRFAVETIQNETANGREAPGSAPAVLTHRLFKQRGLETPRFSRAKATGAEGLMALQMAHRRGGRA